MSILNVVFNGFVIAKIDEDFNLEYQNNNVPLSLSLPTTVRYYSGEAVKIWLSGVVPTPVEDIFTSDFFIKDSDGLDITGALVLTTDVNRLYSEESNKLTRIDKDSLISHLRTQPFVGDSSQLSVNMSLGGAQPKFAYLKNNLGTFKPTYHNPSNVIVKPETTRFQKIATYEHSALQLADICGVPAAKSQVGQTSSGVKYLELARFDRSQDGSRIHTEDLAQALGVSGDVKFDSSIFKEAVKLVKYNLGDKELEVFISQILYNNLIGNCDAHLRNFSIYPHYGKMTPLYDSVPTLLYKDISKKYIVPFGDLQSSSRSLKENHLVAFAEYLDIPREPTITLAKYLARAITANIDSQAFTARESWTITKRLHYLVD